AAWVWITGGIHLDGFADTCDGFYGNRPKEDILKIMRDSRIGTMGAAGIVIILIFKFAALASIHPENMWKILTASTVFGRWSQELACFASVYARDEGKAKHFIGRAKAADILIGAVFTLAVFWLTMGIKGAIVFISSSAAVLLFTWYVKKKIGGMTGDTIGAANEIAETAVLLFALA
ncbi:MAG: adenosylcobinamide-GDP ribazoletransferase, partial [Candidatus Omnitrophica bacterium]|nr:adenosylcobinamide-GDP ribazoletransferase [Candidatus Omnitrophota bacterium]